MKLYTSLTFLSLFTTLSARVASSRAATNACSDVRYPPPSVRPPPDGGYQGHNFAAWTPPPPEHLYGIYHVTHTSYQQWIPSLVNLRSERYPVYPSNDEFPAGSESEIGSWSTCANPNATDCKDPNAISTIFGYNVPIGAQGPTDKKYTAAWRYNATGALEGTVGNLYAIIAWGQDRDGFDYFAQYETDPNTNAKNGGGGIDIVSRNEKGLNPATYICLSSSLKQLAEELEDTELSAIVSEIKPLHDDNRRDREGPVECDTACVENTNSEREFQQLQRRNTEQMQHPLNPLDLVETPRSLNVDLLVETHSRYLYPLGYSRGHRLPWWGWMTMGLVFGIPLVGGLCIAVPIALCKNHRKRQLLRKQRAELESTRHRQSSSVMEPEMAHTA